ncbi:MAG: fatty acid desaturase, partial [Arenicellales bacterium]
MTAVHRHTPVTEALNALIQKMIQQTDLTPEPWALHLLGFITPLLVIAGNLMGGAYTAMGVVFVWFVGPVLDIVMGESRNARPPRQSGLPFNAMLWLHALMHLLVLASFFRFAYLEALLSFWLLTAVLSTGLSAAASAIVTAHEMGHRKPKSLAHKLARLIMFSVNYSHFTTEHNHNHHKWVATEHDPASARKEEGLWLFWARAIPAQFVSSVRVNARKGRTGLR